MRKRSMTVFATAFMMVLLAGVAFAQVGNFSGEDEEPPPVAADEESDVTTTVATEDREEPADEVAQESKERPADDEAPVKHDEEPVEEPVKEEEQKPEDSDASHEADVTPPEFAILHPVDGQVFETEKVAFEGEVEPGARVFAGDWEADVDAEGHWRIVLLLNEGENVATLVAVDAAGNESSDTVTVSYDPPKEQPAEEKEPPKEEPPAEEEPPKEEPPAEEEPPKEEPPAEEEPAAVEFSANQVYGSCGEDIPYDVFWGTATPGTTIYVVSDYGSGTAVTDATGNWELQVNFPSAPIGKSFDVVVEGDGGRAVFSFVATGSGEGEG